MLKKVLSVMLIITALSAFARDAHPGKGPRNHPPKQHPLIAALESNEFSPEERTRLKALAAKDMKAFAKEMRKHFLTRRKAEAQKILALRKAVLEAKTPEAKQIAMEELRAALAKKTDQRTAFHKKILDETERQIRIMQDRCDKLRKEYENRTRNKAQLIEDELKQILSPEPPERLVRSANLDPEAPPPPKRK